MSLCSNILQGLTAHYRSRAVVKSAITNNEIFTLKREYRNYQNPEIASCPHIRTLYDVVRQNEAQEDPICLVFEWMDHDLRSTPANVFRSDQRLPRVVSKAALSALTVFKVLNAVHTGKLCSVANSRGTKRLDISINNIFVSNIDTPSPISKLGDLGNCKCYSYFRIR